MRTILIRTDFWGRCFSVALLTALTLLIERVLLAAEPFDHGWPVCWPTNGITLALLLISRRRHWPFILLSTFLATAIGQKVYHGSLHQAPIVALCNLVEVLVPAFILPRFYTLKEWLQQPKLVWSFVVSAICVGPALSALGMGTYYALRLGQPFWFVVERWGVADVVGIVAYTPLVLVLISPQIYALFRMPQLPGTLSALALLGMASWFVFWHTSLPITFLISPVLLLVATRCGFSGSVVAINLLAPIVTAATLRGYGPFALMTAAEQPYRIITLQLFLILALLVAFPISVARVQQESTSEQLQHAYHQMEALATADGLTGLANRRAFDAALEAEWRRGLRDSQPLAVLMLDADNFKKYNDRYGHPAGDFCLQSIAKAICNIPQRAGDLVARYGGEEFVILLPGIDQQGALNLAEQVRFNVRELDIEHQENSTGRVTISVGCASMIPHDGSNAAALVEGSDRALYTAKQQGRDQSCVHRFKEMPAAALSLRAAQAAQLEA